MPASNYESLPLTRFISNYSARRRYSYLFEYGGRGCSSSNRPVYCNWSSSRASSIYLTDVAETQSFSSIKNWWKIRGASLFFLDFDEMVENGGFVATVCPFKRRKIRYARRLSQFLDSYRSPIFQPIFRFSIPIRDTSVSINFINTFRENERHVWMGGGGEAKKDIKF